MLERVKVRIIFFESKKKIKFMKRISFADSKGEIIIADLVINSALLSLLLHDLSTHFIPDSLKLH